MFVVQQVVQGIHSSSLYTYLDSADELDDPFRELDSLITDTFNEEF